jgi:hypothetical protein
VLIKNTSNRSFNFIAGVHDPGKTEIYDEKTGNLILKSYPDHFKEDKPKKSGGRKKCLK